MKRQYTKAEMKAFARDRLENPEPMTVLESRAENTEVLRIGNVTRLLEHVPARLEIVELRPPSTGPWKMYKVDSFDSDFAGGVCTEFDTWENALAAAKSVPPGYRAYVDDATGTNVLRVVHHAAETLHPW